MNNLLDYSEAKMIKKEMNNSKTFKPYLIHSFYTWALENNRTPYLYLEKNTVSITPEFEIESDIFTLQMHPDSIRNLIFSIDSLFFTTFVNGLSYTMEIPYVSIKRIFCKESDYGFNFSDDFSITETPGLKKPIFSIIEGGKKNNE